MKKTLFLILLLYFSLTGFSQTSIAIKTGANFSKATYLNRYQDNLIDPIRKLKPGFVGGILIHQNLNKIISVQAEILYSQKGLKTIQYPHNKTINSMNFLEIPLSGHYSLIKSKYSSINIYLGGFIALWTDGKYKVTDLYSGETISTKVDFYNEEYKYSRTDAGLLGGFAYKAKKADLFIRYTHSMTGSSQENADALSNRVISVGINYNILK